MERVERRAASISGEPITLKVHSGENTPTIWMARAGKWKGPESRRQMQPLQDQMEKVLPLIRLRRLDLLYGKVTQSKFCGLSAPESNIRRFPANKEKCKNIAGQREQRAGQNDSPGKGLPVSSEPVPCLI